MFAFLYENIFLNLKKNVYNRLKERININLQSPYHVVSLGPSCYAKTILTRWKLKKVKAHGELTLPFDLLWVHEARFISEFIDNSFEGFFADMRYEKSIGSWDNHGKLNFSHETSFDADDKEQLIAMYKKRISNFEQIINDEKPILFVQFLKDKEVKEDINNLYDVLKKVCKPKEFALVIVDAANIIVNFNPEISVLKTQIPFTDCNLYSKSFYKSKEGRKFERNIINFCKKIIKEKLKCKVITYM